MYRTFSWPLLVTPTMQRTLGRNPRAASPDETAARNHKAVRRPAAVRQAASNSSEEVPSADDLRLSAYDERNPTGVPPTVIGTPDLGLIPQYPTPYPAPTVSSNGEKSRRDREIPIPEALTPHPADHNHFLPRMRAMEILMTSLLERFETAMENMSEDRRTEAPIGRGRQDVNNAGLLVVSDARQLMGNNLQKRTKPRGYSKIDHSLIGVLYGLLSDTSTQKEDKTIN